MAVDLDRARAGLAAAALAESLHDDYPTREALAEEFDAERAGQPYSGRVPAAVRLLGEIIAEFPELADAEPWDGPPGLTPDAAYWWRETAAPALAEAGA